MSRFKPNASQVTIGHWTHFAAGGGYKQTWDVTWENSEAWTEAQEREQVAHFKTLTAALAKVEQLLTAKNEEL